MKTIILLLNFACFRSMYVIWLVFVGFTGLNSPSKLQLETTLIVTFSMTLPVVFLADVFTIVCLSLALPCCCSASQNCWLQSCCGPKCYLNKVHVIAPKENEMEFIQINNE